MPQLTDAQCRAAKPRKDRYQLADDRGLSLLVHPNGSKYWMYRYSFQGQRKRISLGQYPDVPLRGYSRCVPGQPEVGQTWNPGARDLALDVCKSVELGEDPAKLKATHAKSEVKPEDTFRTVALEWHRVQSTGWSDTHAEYIMARLEKDVFPRIGKKPISLVTEEDALRVYRAVTDRDSLDLAVRVLEYVERVLRFWNLRPFSQKSLRERGLLLRTKATRHHPACTDVRSYRTLLHRIEAGTTRESLRIGLRLLALFFCRPGALQRARWREFDLAKRLWIIPGDRIGNKKKKTALSEEHMVPLCTQAIQLLGRLRVLSEGSDFLFPNPLNSGVCVSDRAFGDMLEALGYKGKHTPHGFRASARTLMVEELEMGQTEYIECQLGHITKAPNGRAYDRAMYLRQRTELMQTWGDYLDSLYCNRIEDSLQSLSVV